MNKTVATKDKTKWSELLEDTKALYKKNFERIPTIIRDKKRISILPVVLTDTESYVVPFPRLKRSGTFTTVLDLLFARAKTCDIMVGDTSNEKYVEERYHNRHGTFQAVYYIDLKTIIWNFYPRVNIANMKAAYDKTGWIDVFTAE